MTTTEKLSTERLAELQAPLFRAVPVIPGSASSPMQAEAVNGATWQEASSMAAEILSLRSAVVDDAAVERVARAIAKSLMVQDGCDDDVEPKFDDNLSWSYIDQGFVDFALVARAATAALVPGHVAEARKVEAVELLSDILEHIDDPEYIKLLRPDIAALVQS